MPTVPRCWKTLQRKRPRPGHAVGQVDFLLLLELLALLGAEEHAAIASVSLRSSRFSSRDDDERAVDAHHRVAADLQVQVGGAARDGNLEEIVEVHAPTAVVRPGRAPGVHVGQPAVRDPAPTPLMMSKNARWMRLGDRPAPAVADGDLVDRPDRRDLDRRADEERLVGDVEHLARQQLFAHLETQIARDRDDRVARDARQDRQPPIGGV